MITIKLRLFYLACSFVFFSQNALADQPPLKLALLDSNLKPLSWKENGTYIGPIVDIVNQVSTTSGIPIKLIPSPINRTLQLLEKGQEIDGAIGDQLRQGASKYAIYVVPAIANVKMALYTNPHVSKIPRSLDDLIGHKVIKRLGESIVPAFDNAVENGKIEIMNAWTYSSLIEMLRSGRANYAVGVKEAIDSVIIEKGQEKNIKYQYTLINKPLYMYLSRHSARKDQAAVTRKLSMALTELETRGVIKDIYDKYKSAKSR